MQLIVSIWLLLYPATSLYAENTSFKPYYQYSFLFTINNLFPQHLPKTETNLINNNALPNEYLRWLRTDLDKIEGSKMGTPHNVIVDCKIFNTLYNKPEMDEKKMIRESWKKAFGIDVWYPYYKYKEVEDWVKERFSVKVFKLKGKPEFTKDWLLYVFKSKF